MSISSERVLACYKGLVARIIQVAVRDASAAEAELRGEALDWIQNGGLRWACGWLDLDHDWLLNRLRQAGVFDDTATPARTVEERQAMVLDLRRQGHTYREIGDCLGISRQTAFRDVKAAMERVYLTQELEGSKHE